MITFQTVRYKNFLSTGDKFTQIDLTRSRSTLVVGQNGSGKSTMLDAISFALFGKPHRNINKPQLVNSINQKNSIVEVEFKVNNNSYKVIRGIKPAKFEIWKENTLLNQNSHSKEYQKVLEQNILKLNHKSFHQVVVLGSSSFIPFMQLSAVNRRDVIEDLLDINVFSKMNQLLREKISKLKEDLNDNEHQQHVTETKIDAQAKYIRDITKLNQDYTEEKEAKIKEQTDEMFSLQETNQKLLEEIENKKPEVEKEKKRLNDKIAKLNRLNVELKTKAKTVTRDLKFYEDNFTCPSCEQNIPESLKEQKVKEAKTKAKEIKTAMDELEKLGEAEEQKREPITERLQEIYDLELQVNANNQTIMRLQKEIKEAQQSLGELTDSSGDISVAKKDLQELKDALNELREQKYILNEQSQYNTAMSEMLKDTGIKTKIIKQYLPVMNKLVNSYLQILDFFVHFDLDESFNETIRSRHRDSFSYDSFSEGEKQRIDLALLFTWRQIAKMKNSVATNLLVLDETFDSSLDADGVENLMKIIQSLGEDTNVFVISHKGDILEGKFDSKIEFVKEKNFSKIK